MEPQQPLEVKHDGAFRRARAKAASKAHWRVAIRTRNRATQATIRTADKGAQCLFLRGIEGATGMSLASSTSVGCQTEAAIPEVEIDLAKTGASCERCRKFFFKKGSADRHWRLHHAVEPPGGPQEPYHCPYCSFSSYIRKYAQDHEGTHAEEALALRFSTQSCPQDASPVVFAVEPINESSNVCRFCNKYFATRHYRLSHEKFHTTAVTYACEFCSQRFTRKTKLDLHRRSHTGELPHVCNVCQRSFSRKCYLASHAKCHTNVKPFECEICQTCFSSRDHLVAHAKLHRNEKPYECDVCHRCFPHPAHLVTHRKTHVQEKGTANLYSCGVCQMSFAHSSHLTAHRKLHTDPVVNVYSCNVCPKQLAHKSSSAAHEELHTEPNVQMYSCSVCQESFLHKGVLEEHEKKAHAGVSEKPYVCIVCHETFPHKMGLLNHNCTLITTRMIAASIQSASLGELP